jgi:hypothetical protein
MATRLRRKQQPAARRLPAVPPNRLCTAPFTVVPGSAQLPGHCTAAPPGRVFGDSPSRPGVLPPGCSTPPDSAVPRHRPPHHRRVTSPRLLVRLFHTPLRRPTSLTLLLLRSCICTAICSSSIPAMTFSCLHTRRDVRYDACVFVVWSRVRDLERS